MGEEARCGRNAGGEWTRLGDEAGPLPRATPAALTVGPNPGQVQRWPLSRCV